MPASNLSPEQQIGLPVQYTPEVAERLLELDIAHDLEPDESLLAYGLVEWLSESEPVVVSLVSTLNRRLRLPDDFPLEVAGFLAEGINIRLALRVNSFDEWFVSLETDSPKGGTEGQVTLAYLNEDRTIRWCQEHFDKLVQDIAKYFFEESTSLLEDVISQLVDQKINSGERVVVKEVPNNYFAWATTKWALLTHEFERAIAANIESAGLNEAETDLFWTHYHPRQYLEGEGNQESVDRLLRFSDFDLKSFVRSDNQLMQVRTVLDDTNADRVWSRTISKAELQPYADCFAIFDRLRVLAESHEPASVAEVEVLVREYLKSIPADTVSGVDFIEMFQASVRVYIDMVSTMDRRWQRKVYPSGHLADDLKEYIEETGFYGCGIASLAIHHLTKLHVLPRDVQQQFPVEILSFVESAQLFKLVATIVWSLYSSYHLNIRDHEEFATMDQLIATPYMTDQEQIKAILAPYVRLMLADTTGDFEFFTHFFNLDLPAAAAHLL